MDGDNSLNYTKLDRLCMMLSDLHNSGYHVLVVSSGSILLGSLKAGYKSAAAKLIEQQVTAAIGQAELIKMYQQYLGEYNQVVAQVLLTHDVIRKDIRRQNATNTLNKLLELNIIPIVNENDVVSTEDIALEDNYPLALQVAQLVNADIILVKEKNNGDYLVIPKHSGLGYAVTENKLKEALANFMGRQPDMAIGRAYPSTVNELNEVKEYA
ncbi:MAG: hypothetical protein HC896_13720 [Bacteroidales bacterium]|nr:hypothetical protein [Bacteroidales bacterium]